MNDILYNWSICINELLDANIPITTIKQTDNELIIKSTKLNVILVFNYDNNNDLIKLTINDVKKNIRFEYKDHIYNIAISAVQFIKKHYPLKNYSLDYMSTTVSTLIKVLERKLSLNKYHNNYWINEPTITYPGCYKLLFFDNTEYIGQSISLKRRLSEHLSKNYGSEIKEITIYPINNDSITKEELLLFEQELISHFATYEDGRNKNRGQLINPQKLQSIT